MSEALLEMESPTTEETTVAEVSGVNAEELERGDLLAHDGVPAAVPVGEKPKDIKGVFVLDGKKVMFVPVETGITGESDIEITSGLQPNMEVITGPSRVLRTLKEGDTVKKQTVKPGEGKAEEKK